MQTKPTAILAVLFTLALGFGRATAADKPASDSPAKPDSKADAKKDEAKWHSLFDGKGLGEWKPSKFATQGSVDVEDGQIVLGFGDGCSGITWKGKFPKTNYEIRLEAKRVDGTDF